MPDVIQDSVSIAANADSDVLSDKINAVIPVDSRGGTVSFAFTGSATGLEAEAYVGDRPAIERGGVSTANRMPRPPEDVVNANVPGYAGERVRLRVYNTTAGALTVFYRVSVTQI